MQDGYRVTVSVDEHGDWAVLIQGAGDNILSHTYGRSGILDLQKVIQAVQSNWDKIMYDVLEKGGFEVQHIIQSELTISEPVIERSWQASMYDNIGELSKDLSSAGESYITQRFDWRRTEEAQDWLNNQLMNRNRVYDFGKNTDTYQFISLPVGIDIKVDPSRVEVYYYENYPVKLAYLQLSNDSIVDQANQFRDYYTRLGGDKVLVFQDWASTKDFEPEDLNKIRTLVFMM